MKRTGRYISIFLILFFICVGSVDAAGYDAQICAICMPESVTCGRGILLVMR